MVNWPGKMGKAKFGEWLWRFVAAVMLFAVGWSIWILYQIHPPALITNAAFEAAARANAKQSAQGIIVRARSPALPTEPPREPPINADRLKLSDSLSEKK
jgi:hypothetical protein